MRYLKTLTTLLILAGLTLSASAALAADHIDSPAAVADPAADITDLYAWMSPDAEKVNLVLDVFPFADGEAAFSDAVAYVFHINSANEYGAEATETTIICAFTAGAAFECWAGDDYASGNVGDDSGIESDNGNMTVFAGLRNDPFFMEFVGFTETVDTVIGAAGGLQFDGAGCPQLDEATSNLLVGQLMSGAEGAAASDTFAGANVLSLVVQVDKSIVTPGGPLLGVWASTHAIQ